MTFSSLQDHVVLKSEVYFPNLQFETTEVMTKPLHQYHTCIQQYVYVLALWSSPSVYCLYSMSCDASFAQVDFGCILNDTETLHYVRMTNTSPLEVQYSWAFLHRPPVRRGDPDLQDEGVDMQSECETESLEGEESEGVEEEEEEEEEREEREEDEVEEEARREEEEEEREEENSEEQSSVSCCESAQSRQDMHEEESSQVEPEGLEQKREVMEPVLDSGGVKEEGPAQDKEEQSEGGKTVGTKRSKLPRQPWELVADPFTPISIEQVSHLWKQSSSPPRFQLSRSFSFHLLPLFLLPPPPFSSSFLLHPSLLFLFPLFSLSQQVFDILPLHGTLLPGQSQQVQFTFYGHKGVATDVMAVCQVEGGPTYQVRLSGEASGVQYRFSRTHINMGQQVQRRKAWLLACMILHSSFVSPSHSCMTMCRAWRWYCTTLARWGWTSVPWGSLTAKNWHQDIPPSHPPW